MPDDAPQTGHRVLRWPGFAAGEWRYEQTNRRPDAIRNDSRLREDVEYGVWHSLDPKALAEMRETATLAAAQMMAANRLPGDVADAVIQVIGLTPPEPKEGGASA